MAIHIGAFQIWAARTEGCLTQALASGDKPFLGLYDDLLNAKGREYLCGYLRTQPQPFQVFLRGLQRWPAVFAAFLTHQVRDSYGTGGTAAVYPFIEQALFDGQRTLLPLERIQLVDGFRKACLRLGLGVIGRRPGSDRMVDEYLHQAGVPLTYAGPLAEKMAEQAASVGLPEDDDPAAIELWRLGLPPRLKKLSKTVTAALEGDELGYYVRLFLKIRKNLHEPGNIQDPVEQAMAKALAANQAHQAAAKPMAIPRVVWRDGRLGVDLPAGEQYCWELTCGEQWLRYEGLVDRRFVPLQDDLPARLEVRESHGGATLSHTLWKDQADNRILVFAADGNFAGSGQLAQTKPLRLPPGEFLVLSRFVPAGFGDEAENLSTDPSLWCWPMALAPGQFLEMSRGPARLAVQADNRPLLALSGLSVRDARGTEVWGSVGLSVSILLPWELAESGTREFLLQLRLSGTDSVKEISISLDPPAMPEATMQQSVSLETACLELPAGVGRLVVELRRRDVARPLVRTGVLLWNGLTAVEDRVCFHCARPPKNLDHEHSENLRLADTGPVSFRDDTKRFFKMMFSEGAGRWRPLTWMVPGLFLFLRDYTEEGVREQVLRKGTLLAVHPTTRAKLELYATSGGWVTLGQYRRPLDAGRGLLTVQLSLLSEYLQPGQDQLLFQQEGCDTAETLLQLTGLQRAQQFLVEANGVQQRVKFRMAEPCDSLQLVAEDLVGGTRIELSLACNEPQTTGGAAWARLVCGNRARDGAVPHELSFFLEHWPPGAWLVRLSAQVRGRWGELCNEREDVYSVGFVLDPNGARLHHPSLPDGGDALLQSFERFHRAMLTCYALESWNYLNWLESGWHSMAARLQPGGCQSLARLVALEEAGAPERASPTWIPLWSVAVRFPWLLSRPVAEYRSLPQRGGSLGTSLRLLSSMGSPRSILADGVVDPAFAAGFGNLAEIVRGGNPAGFTESRYRAALRARDIPDRLRLLRQDDWRPGQGDLLGPLHYRYVVASLAERYQATLAGNPFRRSEALKLAWRLVHRTETGWLLDDAAPDCGEDVQQAESLLVLGKLIRILAKAARQEAREPGLWGRLTGQGGAPAGQDQALRARHHGLSWLLAVGGELFNFYLLYWELVLATPPTATGNQNQGH